MLLIKELAQVVHITFLVFLIISFSKKSRENRLMNSRDTSSLRSCKTKENKGFSTSIFAGSDSFCLITSHMLNLIIYSDVKRYLTRLKMKRQN